MKKTTNFIKTLHTTNERYSEEEEFDFDNVLCDISETEIAP